MIISDVEVADRHLLVGTLIVSTHELDLDAVFVPKLQIFGEERLDMVVTRRASDEPDGVIVLLLSNGTARHGDAGAKTQQQTFNRHAYVPFCFL